MFIAIFRFIGMIALLVVFILWILAVLESDGHCHFDDCDLCPYDPEECPEKERKRHEESDE